MIDDFGPFDPEVEKYIDDLDESIWFSITMSFIAGMITYYAIKEGKLK